MKKVDIRKVHTILTKQAKHWQMPIVELMEIQTKDPFKVLVTTILSARTKDETTAKAARNLFRVVKKIEDLRSHTLNRLEKLIYPVGFYKMKAKHLSQLPDALDNLFQGMIPETVEELIQLPGVGRKTANLVVAVAFKKPAICVDTHVHRITNRLGYLVTSNPLETEMALRKNLPKDLWMSINTVLVTFGQHLCHPVSPECSRCPVRGKCKRVGVTQSR